MGDVIVLMNKGIIMQQSSPKDMYHNPENTFAAQFIGTPPMNIVDSLVPGVSIGFRPEKAAFAGDGSAALVLNGTIVTKEQLGAEYNYSVATAEGKIMVKSEDDQEPGACRLFVRPEHLFVFDREGKRSGMSEAILARLPRV